MIYSVIFRAFIPVVELLKHGLQLFRNGQSEMGRILQQGNTLIGKVEANHCAAQSVAGTYHMKVNDVGNANQQND